ncbi:MAG: hypothetical protein E6Q97_39000 [Desulfurellales bacterium]|nr:MAG: hypothetical protein E6Q97_39000 [Desulfurellales bacterium]
MITLSSLGALIGVLTFVSAIVLSLARTVWLVAAMKAQLDLITRELREHIANSSLHRNPDSEARWDRLEKAIESLTTLVNDIRTHLPNGGKA